jgi:hypothetical protein
MALRRLGNTVIGLTIFALVDGFVIGLVAGIFAQTVAASPASIDSNEYVWLVSVDYAAAGDLSKATQRLSNMQNGTRQLSALVRRVARQAESRHDTPRVTLLTRLANALAGDGPATVDAAVEVETDTPTPVVSVAPSLPPTHNTADQGPHEWAGIPASAGSTAAPTATRQPTPTATASGGKASRSVLTAGGSSSADFRISLVRQLSPCENGGNHHLHILVLDRQGHGVPNMPVEIVWASGRYVDTTGQKVESIPSLGIDANTTPGYLNFPMYHGSYKARVLQGSSDQTDWLTVDIPRNELCVRVDNPNGNSLFHYSYEIVFVKAR